jgi:ribonuclease HI
MLSFGKYKGYEISKIFRRDPSYLNWLSNQPWFREKNASLYETIQKIKTAPITPKNTHMFTIYTDGACKNNGMKHGDIRAGIGIHFSPTNTPPLEDVSERLFRNNLTNNVAELIAIKKALQLCHLNNIDKDIMIYTDSEYSLKCITEWYPKWVEKNTLTGKKNIDILRDISCLLEKTTVSFQHIKSHTGLLDEHSVGNQIADDLANQCLK